MKLPLEIQLEWLPMSCISTNCITQSHVSVHLMMLTECEQCIVCLPYLPQVIFSSSLMLCDILYDLYVSEGWYDLQIHITHTGYYSSLGKRNDWWQQGWHEQ